MSVASPPHVCSFHLPGSSSHQYLTASPWRLVPASVFTPSIIDELILLDLNLQGLPCHLPRLQSMTQELSRMWSLPAFPASFLIVLHFEFYAVATSSSSCVPHLQWQLALLAFLLQFLYPSPYFTWLTPFHPLRLNFLFLQHFTVRCSVYVIDWLTVLLLKRNHKRCQAFTYRCLLDQN